MKILKTLFLTSMFLLPISAFAQLEGNPENWCRNGLFPRESENYFSAAVKGKKGDRVFFYGDGEKDCPSGKNCRLKSYLIPNDEVIVSRKFAGFACAWYQPKKGAETVGWLPLDKLEFDETAKTVDKKAWMGTWRYYDNEIKIAATEKPDVFKITGNAFWKGLGDNIHIGELDGDAKLSDGTLKYGADDEDEYACKVTLRLIDKFLIVSDNLNCGGANVSFSGVYKKNSPE